MNDNRIRLIYNRTKKASNDTAQPKTVLLIHGLEGVKYTLTPLNYRFLGAGWNTHRYQYPCHKISLYDAADALTEKLKSIPRDQFPEYVVGYSLGGVVLSEALRKTPQPFKRILFVGSPLLYSHSARVMQKVPGAKFYFGPALDELAIDREPYIPAGIECGSLAAIGPAIRRINPLLPEPNDGIVQITETHPPAIKEQLTLRDVHIGLVVRKGPFQKITNFLELGKFL